MKFEIATGSVRVSWLESDLDRVDEKFVEAAGNVVHAKTNLNTALQGLEHRLETYTDKLESKVERIEAEHKAEMDEMRAEHKKDFAEHKKETSAEIGGNRKVMVAVLLSMLATAITFATAVITMRGGG